MMKNKEKAVSTLTKGVEFLLKKNKVTYIKGHAKFKSINKIAVIDDKKNVTLLSVSSVEKDIKSLNKSNKTELSKLVAEKLAKKAQEKKISKIYFDRGIYKYHGRIKVFAEILRKNGMEL